MDGGHVILTILGLVVGTALGYYLKYYLIQQANQRTKAEGERLLTEAQESARNIELKSPEMRPSASGRKLRKRSINAGMNYLARKIAFKNDGTNSTRGLKSSKRKKVPSINVRAPSINVLTRSKTSIHKKWKNCNASPR